MNGLSPIYHQARRTPVRGWHTVFNQRAGILKLATGLNEGLAIRLVHSVITFVLAAANYYCCGLVLVFADKTRTMARSMEAFSDNEDLASYSLGSTPEKVATIVSGAGRHFGNPVSGTLYGLDKTYKNPSHISMLLLPMFAAAIVGAARATLWGPEQACLCDRVFRDFCDLCVQKILWLYFAERGKLPSGIIQIIFDGLQGIRRILLRS